MTYFGVDAWWWPYFFILAAGWLATDGWRFLGAYLGGRISEDSEALVAVRLLATALVAAVIGNLVVFPGGALAAVPLELRLMAVCAGFGVFLLTGRRVLVGIVATEAALLAGLWFIGFSG